MEKFLIFGGMALVTYFTRYTMIAIMGRELPDLLRRWLRYVPPAVLAALIAPAVLAPQGHLELSGYLWAAIGALLVAWRTRQPLPTLIGGLVTYWLLRLLG